MQNGHTPFMVSAFHTFVQYARFHFTKKEVMCINTHIHILHFSPSLPPPHIQHGQVVNSKIPTIFYTYLATNFYE